MGGGHGGVEILGGYMDMREAIIQRQLEKKRIREEILAEDAARRCVLEAEVRRELMLESHNGGGYESSFMLGPPINQNSRLEPAMQRGQPFAPVSFEERYGGSGRHRSEIGDFEAVLLQRPLWSPGDGKLNVIVLGKPNGGANQKQPPAAAGSSELNHCPGEIGLGVVPKKSVKKQLSLIKNSSKYVSTDSKKEDKKTKFAFWCAMCGVGASSKIVLNEHKEGKKHMKNLQKLDQRSGGHKALGVRKRSSGMKPKKRRRKQKSHKASRHVS